MVKNSVEVALRSPYPLFSASTFVESKTMEKPVALFVLYIDQAMRLMNHDIVEEIVETKGKCCGGIASATIVFLDENANADTTVDGVEVEQVYAPDGTVDVFQ